MKTVGERIRQAREFRRMSGEELAHAAGYKHQSGISNIENRATSRGGMGVQKIAQALNVSIEWLINGPDTEDMTTVGRFNEAPKAVTWPMMLVKDRAIDSETDWPFHTVTKPQWATIPPETKEIIETFVRSMVQDAARNTGTD